MKHIIHILLLTGIITPLLAFGGVFGPNNIVPFPATPAADKAPGNSMLSAAYFPTTAADTTFTERLESKSIGYEPFKDMSAYRDLVVTGEEHYIERELAKLETERISDSQTMSNSEYCEKYPLDETRCETDTTTTETIIEIGNASATHYETAFTDRTIGGGPVIARNDVHGGSCYPAAKNKVFKNKILTTGQYEKQYPAFEKALITIFRKEGACGIIKNDPCGYTCYGIGSKCMNVDVKNMTRADAERLYHDRFWKKYNIYLLPDVIATDVFLATMASGPCTAIQQFRKFLGLSKNCKIDDAVVSAVENYSGDIHNDWLDVRQKFLVDVAKRRYNNSVLKGWMNAIKLKRENGCHTVPAEPLYRD